MTGRRTTNTTPEERRAIGLRIADEHRTLARRIMATADRIERRALALPIRNRTGYTGDRD